MNIKCIFYFLIFFIFFTPIAFTKNVYNTDFFHIEILSQNTSQTKFEEINTIKIKSLKNILFKILLNEDYKYILRKIDYKNDLDKVINNIIIENELITNQKYIADIKVNFQKKEIINLLRNNKLNYSDISDTILLISSYEEKFITSGLISNNLFYDKKLLNIYEYNDNLINFLIPNLNANDRYILPYNKIINKDKIILSKMSQKYKTQFIYILNIYKKNVNLYEINSYLYSDLENDIQHVSTFNIKNIKTLHKNIFNNLNDWWKKNNLINNKIYNEITCKILSKDFSDLIYIKNKIRNISQFKSMNLKTISLKNNIETIIYYGDFFIFKKSLMHENIFIYKENNECIIKSNINESKSF